MQQQIRTVERKIAEQAGRSHGVITRAELLRAGVTPEQIRTRLAKGALISIHRGVFRVGHTAPSLEARYLAAVRHADRDPLSRDALRRIFSISPGALLHCPKF